MNYDLLTRQAESTGQYQMPFKDGFSRWAIIDSSLTFVDYTKDDGNWYAQEYKGKRHRYTHKEMCSNWECIEVQRVVYKAAMLVFYGKYKGINPAKRSLGLKDT